MDSPGPPVPFGVNFKCQESGRPGDRSPGLARIRTCPIQASGSSRHGVRYAETTTFDGAVTLSLARLCRATDSPSCRVGLVRNTDCPESSCSAPFGTRGASAVAHVAKLSLEQPHPRGPLHGASVARVGWLPSRDADDPCPRLVHLVERLGRRYREQHELGLTVSRHVANDSPRRGARQGDGSPSCAILPYEHRAATDERARSTGWPIEGPGPEGR
jgi:hypothetical protein